MKDKEFYRICIAVLTFLCEKKSLTEKECKSIAGIYYKDVTAELKERDAIYNFGYGDFEWRENASKLLDSRYYEKRIKEIEDEEYRTELDNKSKIATIKGTRIAKWALWLSILSLTGIVQDLIAWIGTFISETIKDYL
jgi:nucleoid DNA-binding protein